MTTATHLERHPKQIIFVPWVCKCGNEISAPSNAVDVWCNLAGHRGTNRMTRKDIA